MAARRLPASLLAIGALCALTGCGLGAGQTPGGVTLTVTRDFGAIRLPSPASLRAHGEETVMSLLMRNYRVTTRYGGGFVESIDGRSGGDEGGQPIDWFYYVNGIEGARGAAETTVHPGDAVWWDLHDWSQTEEVPAVVGSFPEPFLRGTEGKRLPVRLECVTPGDRACATIDSRLGALGVPAGVAALSPGGETPETLRVAVGPWSAVRAIVAAQSLMQGPHLSGVYARMASNGASITLLDDRGAATATLGAGSGLIAAVRYINEAPLWIVTGTDAAGVERAAADFDRTALDGHFAIAVSAAGSVLPLPYEG